MSSQKPAINPALTDWTGPLGLPDFTAFTDDDFAPAFEAALAADLADVDAIINHHEAPTIDNTLKALQLSGEGLNRASSIFWMRAGANTNDTIQALERVSEGKVLEDPWQEAPEYVHQRTISPMEAPDKVTEIEIAFEKGDAVAIDGKPLSPATLLKTLNDLGRDNGIGRLDLVENRFVGMKSRGVYETPGGTILLAAHRAMESITLDRGAAHLKDEFMPRYAELIYNGFWYSPEREMLQAMIDKSQEDVEGVVRLKLYKGNVMISGRKSKKSLYSDALVTFEDDRGAYDQKDAAGFIRLNALRLRTLAARKRNS